MTRTTLKLRRLHQLRTQLADAAARERSLVSQQLIETERHAVALQDQTRTWQAEQTSAKDAWRMHRAASDVAHRAHDWCLQRAAALRTSEAELRIEEQAAAIARDQAEQLVLARKQLEKIEAERRSQKEIDDLYSAARVRGRRATLL